MRPKYGIDAPGLVRGFFVGGLALLFVSMLLYQFASDIGPWSRCLAAVVLVASLYAFGMFCLMVWWSLVVKVKGREQILDLVTWTGKEMVLDIGCGRGLMLIGAAKRLTSGTAIGVDIWQAQDQSANSADAALENARLAGVSDRVTVNTADMRKLPFEACTFDVVVSHWVVHNVEPKADRMSAMQEMVRVLRPNGTILLADIVNRQEYVDEFVRLGAGDVRLVVRSAVQDNLLRLVSFGSFQPATIIASEFPN